MEKLRGTTAERAVGEASHLRRLRHDRRARRTPVHCEAVEVAGANEGGVGVGVDDQASRRVVHVHVARA